MSINLPPGPKEGRWLQMLKFLHYPIAFIHKCRHIYGKTFTLRLLGCLDTVIISEVADLKQVLSASSDELRAGEINATLFHPLVGEHSLLTIDGSSHLQHKKLLLPFFHNQRVKVYGDLITSIVEKRIASWKEKSTLTMTDEARDITFSIILSSIFGIDEENTRFKKLTDSLHTLIHEISKPFALITSFKPSMRRNLGALTPWAKIAKLRRQVFTCLLEEIKARDSIDLKGRTDILSLLLQACDDKGNRLMTYQEIRDEMLTLLITGHETSTMGIAWAIYGILSNPMVLQKLQEELQGVANKDLVSHLDQLTYLDGIIKEALRVTPVIPYVIRLTKGTYRLGDYILPKNTPIIPCIYLAHHDPDVWHEPEKFMPERFLNGSKIPSTYLPFGSGIRRCIGSAFAHYEMKIIIAQIFLRTKLHLRKKYISTIKNKGVVTIPSRGLPVIVKTIIS